MNAPKGFFYEHRGLPFGSGGRLNGTHVKDRQAGRFISARRRSKRSLKRLLHAEAGKK
jgi:hypothetical protein